MTRFLLPLVLFLVLGSAAAGAPRELALLPCTVTGAAQALCGTFDVPEDRAVPDGRRIALRVAVVPARDGGTKPDPIVYLAGGPGGSAIASAPFVLSVFAAANQSRDVVLVDQRGTGGSAPASCPPPKTRLASQDALRGYVKACLAKLEVDPSHYATIPAMDDLADVLRALGYGQVNVVGGSYGATAAQYFLVQHPEHVRSVVLDGATLLDVPIFELYARNGDAALRSILSRCARSKRCATAYPRVRREVFEVLASLRRKPVRLGGSLVDAADAAGAIQLMTRTPEGAAQIPWLAHEARTGNLLPLDLAVSKFEASTPTVLMYWSIVCNEPWARRDPARSAAASRGTYLADVAANDARAVSAACSLLPKVEQPAWSASRPATDRPVLIVAGGADPQDPPSSVAGAGATMPNSRTVVVPGAGHGALHLGCVPELVQQFVDAGSAAGLDVSCAKRYSPLAFVVR